MLTVLVILLVLLLLAPPYYPYSRGWGWGPSGLLGVVLVVLLLVYLLGGVPVRVNP